MYFDVRKGIYIDKGSYFLHQLVTGVEPKKWKAQVLSSYQKRQILTRVRSGGFNRFLFNSIGPVMLNVQQGGTGIANVNCSDVLDECLKSTFRLSLWPWNWIFK